jgi:hypothetical protein
MRRGRSLWETVWPVLVCVVTLAVIFWGVSCQIDMCMEDGHTYWECMHYLGSH